MEEGFGLDPRIAAASAHVADWPLCQLRLKDDARFPWLLLVPRRAGVVELTDLSPADQAALGGEVLRACRLLQAVAKPDKLNVATLGNVVPQLHVHVVGRFAADAAWPGAVWCAGDGPAHAGDGLARSVALYADEARKQSAP